MRNASQNGIVYNRSIIPGKSNSILLLKINEGISIPEAGKTLLKLWGMYMDLEKGKILGLSQTSKNLYTGNLSTQIGYTPKLFERSGVKREAPVGFASIWKFNDPSTQGGGPLIDGISLNYAADVKVNHVASDDIMIQFIGDDEFTVTRPIVETQKLIKKSSIGKKESLIIDRFYTGFKRDDRRGWLGFHDGITKVKYDQRSLIILINRNNLSRNDFWTLNGTYMSFLRIAIDLDRWDKLPLVNQELIIGRKKVSGCPIIGTSPQGEPITDRNCPAKGTTEVIEDGNEVYRDQRYGNEIVRNRNFTKRDDSHVGRNLFVSMTRPRQLPQKIFRQGFHFIESTESEPTFRVGLNFISYQSTVENFFRSLGYGFGTNTDGQTNNEFNLSKYFSVRAAGIFLVPPHNEKEDFPGSSIFYLNEPQYNVPVPSRYSNK